MVTTCPVCRDVVHLSSGYIVRHGALHHGVFALCAGSGSPFRCFVDCCG